MLYMSLKGSIYISRSILTILNVKHQSNTNKKLLKELISYFLFTINQVYCTSRKTLVYMRTETNKAIL
jgi:hypothetical protein